jgi:hypothetical protein
LLSQTPELQGKTFAFRQGSRGVSERIIISDLFLATSQKGIVKLDIQTQGSLVKLFGEDSRGHKKKFPLSKQNFRYLDQTPF